MIEASIEYNEQGEPIGINFDGHVVERDKLLAEALGYAQRNNPQYARGLLQAAWVLQSEGDPSFEARWKWTEELVSALTFLHCGDRRETLTNPFWGTYGFCQTDRYGRRWWDADAMCGVLGCEQQEGGSVEMLTPWLDDRAGSVAQVVLNEDGEETQTKTYVNEETILKALSLLLGDGLAMAA